MSLEDETEFRRKIMTAWLNLIAAVKHKARKDNGDLSDFWEYWEPILYRIKNILTDKNDDSYKTHVNLHDN
jgi:hypothetical protein